MIHWSTVFGGWPNAFQGIASAVVGGLVAAITAWLVVGGTARVERQRALENESREVARELTRSLVTTFVGVPDSRPLREDIEMAALLNMELRTAAALLARHDQKLAQLIQDRADSVAKIVESWNTDVAVTRDAAAPQRYNLIRESVDDLHERVINWLGNVAPRSKA